MGKDERLRAANLWILRLCARLTAGDPVREESLDWLVRVRAKLPVADEVIVKVEPRRITA